MIRSKVESFKAVRKVSELDWTADLGEKGFEVAGMRLDFRYSGLKINLISYAELMQLRSKLGITRMGSLATKLCQETSSNFRTKERNIEPAGLYVYHPDVERPRSSAPLGFLNMFFTPRSAEGILAERKVLLDSISSEISDDTWQRKYVPFLRVGELVEGPLADGAVEDLSSVLPRKIKLLPGEIVMPQNSPAKLS